MNFLGGCGSAGRAGRPLIRRLMVRADWSVFKPDTEPQVAPDGQASTLHGSLLLLVCECVCECENERQIEVRFE